MAFDFSISFVADGCTRVLEPSLERENLEDLYLHQCQSEIEFLKEDKQFM